MRRFAWVMVLVGIAALLYSAWRDDQKHSTRVLAESNFGYRDIMVPTGVLHWNGFKVANPDSEAYQCRLIRMWVEQRADSTLWVGLSLAMGNQSHTAYEPIDGWQYRPEGEQNVSVLPPTWYDYHRQQVWPFTMPAEDPVVKWLVSFLEFGKSSEELC